MGKVFEWSFWRAEFRINKSKIYNSGKCKFCFPYLYPQITLSTCIARAFQVFHFHLHVFSLTWLLSHMWREKYSILQLVNMMYYVSDSLNDFYFKKNDSMKWFFRVSFSLFVLYPRIRIYKKAACVTKIHWTLPPSQAFQQDCSFTRKSM